MEFTFNYFPTLETERLRLIEIKQEHLTDVYQIFSNREVTRFYNVVPLTEPQQAQKFVDHFSNRFCQKAAVRWGITLKGHDQIFGTIGYNNFAKHHRANIGYELLPHFWNQGYAKEALQAVIQFGFSRLLIHRIEAEVMQGNTGSEKLLQKLGFTREGILRSWMYWNGQHYDMTMFSLLLSEAGLKM